MFIKLDYNYDNRIVLVFLYVWLIGGVKTLLLIINKVYNLKKSKTQLKRYEKMMLKYSNSLK